MTHGHMPRAWLAALALENTMRPGRAAGSGGPSAGGGLAPSGGHVATAHGAGRSGRALGLSARQSAAWTRRNSTQLASLGEVRDKAIRRDRKASVGATPSFGEMQTA
jgi:hypothetical protein